MLLDNQASSTGAASTGAALLVARLAQMLETARANADTHYEVTKRLVAEASSLLELHLASHTGPETGQRSQGCLARWQINRVRTFIDQHLTECIRVSDLSAIARSSPSYFSCAFKRTFGASPHAYLMRRRISMAVELMLGSDAPLSEIAISCGFADQAHFSRQFRRTMGYTPSTWRRERAPRPFSR
jgi:AraC family transcriptional regulator